MCVSGDEGCETQIAGCRPQAAEMSKKAMSSVSPDSCIFPYREKC